MKKGEKTSTGKIIKRVIIAAVSLILIAALILTGTMFMYYPHYLKRKKTVQIEYPASSLGEIRVMSCNLRCINPLDFGKKSWFYRADLVIRGIMNNTPGIIGFQEATKWQYKYLTDSLPQYDSVIEYRDEAFNSEGCPVFYRKDLYNLTEKGSFWLSETPDEMSKSWNSAYNRVCSYVILEDKETGNKFVVFNTHLDHKSEDARINGMKVVLEKIKQFGSLPAVIMGDFNAEEDTPTYKSATEMFNDAKYLTAKPDTGCTYQGFGEYTDHENIDYFMISKEGFTVEEFKRITDTYDGVYSSDHFPIFTVLKFA